MIPYGRQNISDEDIAAVIEVLKSDFLTQGPEVLKFEQTFAKYCGAKHAVAVSSCTAALHISYMALGIDKNSIVWTVPNTFVATANAALYCGAKIDFVDTDPKTYLMCPNKLLEKLIEAKANNSLPNLVVPVHFSGSSCEMDKIHELSKEYGFKLVEDAAHCAGASYQNQKVGSCQYSDAACFSFHPVKIMTSAEGGIVTTNDKALYDRMMIDRTHGVTKDPSQMQDKNAAPWLFEQQTLGYHYRITDMQCALATSQMSRLDDFIVKRRELVSYYNKKLHNLPVQLPVIADEDGSSWHLYVVKLLGDFDREAVFNAMRSKQVGVNVHYIPVHTHPYYRELGFDDGMFPEAEDYYNNALTLPLFYDLTFEEVDYIVECLTDVLNDQG